MLSLAIYYCPISLTPVFSKVFEHIVKNKLLAFISANHLQDPNQHDIVSNRSVVSDLLISDSILRGFIKGYVLGPAPYSIYSSSISNLINHAHYLFYADDLKLIWPLTSVTSHTDLQSDLDRLDKWAAQWGMFFSKDNCHALHFGSNNPRHVYMLGNYNLIAVDSADDLGLLREATSPDCYDCHIELAIKKSFGALFLILHGLSSSRCINIMHTVAYL